MQTCTFCQLDVKHKQNFLSSLFLDHTCAGCIARTVTSPNQHVLRSEDVVSCCLDLSVPSISFRINGQPVQGMFENFNSDGLFFPVASFSAGVKSVPYSKHSTLMKVHLLSTAILLKGIQYTSVYLVWPPKHIATQYFPAPQTTYSIYNYTVKQQQ